MQVGGGVRRGFVPAAMLGLCMSVEFVSQGKCSYSCVCIVVLLPECVADLFAHPCVSVVKVSVGAFVFVHLCFRVSDCTQVGVSVPVVVHVVSAGTSVQPWVRVGAVAVSAAQRAEDHGAARNRAAMFDLQVDGIVVDLQRSYKERRKL